MEIPRISSYQSSKQYIIHYLCGVSKISATLKDLRMSRTAPTQLTLHQAWEEADESWMIMNMSCNKLNHWGLQLGVPVMIAPSIWSPFSTIKKTPEVICFL